MCAYTRIQARKNAPIYTKNLSQKTNDDKIKTNWFIKFFMNKVLTIKCTQIDTKIYHKKEMTIKLTQSGTQNLSQKSYNDKDS